MQLIIDNMKRIEQPESVNSALGEIFDKMYISAVKNRLRELDEPTDNDCKRWVWELIQNAKDSISQDEHRKAVDVRLIVRDKEVKFLHNGSPFTAKALFGLLYKYSEGKENNSESTGRFGTGFLTTHSLSKTVSIEGDVYTEDDRNPLCGFSATMYRDGLDETELLEGVKRMKDNMVYTNEIKNWTTYTYHLKTPQNEKALQLGLENFISNIAQVMLFCKELNSIELDNNGLVTKIIRNESRLLENDIYLSEFEIKGETNYTRKFVQKAVDRHSDELTKRFNTQRNLRLTAAYEIDNEKNIVENHDAPSHFCVLPLVGSEKHIMPVYLNSPDFEPDSERESLILIGDEIIPDRDMISNGGINRLILKESISLYDSLVSYLSKNGYHKLFLLAKGLKKLPKVEKNFDREWFEAEIINPYRDVLKKYEIVETQIGNQKLFADDGTRNILIPKDASIENQTGIYDLLTDVFPEKLPLTGVAKEWADLAWKECGLFKIEDLCEYVAGKKNINNLSLSSNPSDWLNRFLLFIKKTNESRLKEFKLIPNSYGDFMSLEDKGFAEGSGLTEYMIEVLKDLGEDIKPVLLGNGITSVTLPLKIDAKRIAEKVNEQAESIIKKTHLSDKEKINQLLPLLNTIPTDEEKFDTAFIFKQKQMHSFTEILFPDLSFERTINNDIPEKAWQALHKWLIKILMEKVSTFKHVDALPDVIEDKIEWIDRFIAFVSKEINEGGFDEYPIIPNQKGDFCLKKNLWKDANIPEELKSDRAEQFGLKLKASLLHKNIASINISKEKNINTVIELVSDIFKNNRFEADDDCLDFAVFLLHFLPEETSKLLYNSQKRLLEIVQNYYYERSEPYSPTIIACNAEDFWRKANDHIVQSLQGHLEEDADLENLKAYLSESGRTYDDGDTVIFLNDFYDYLKNSGRTMSGKIVPNQNGVFCSLEKVYKDENIPEPLKDILSLVTPDDDFRDILADASLSVQPAHAKNMDDITQILDKTIIDIFENQPWVWDDNNFKKAIELLMMEWFPKHKDEAESHFRYIYDKKETIEMNVLWSLEERQRMQRARSIAPDLLDKFIETNGDIHQLEKEKEALEAKVAELQAQADFSESNVKIVEIAAEFPDITADRIRELLKLEERVKGWNGKSDYRPANEDEERRNYENGYKGEAYIYSLLKKSEHFKNVTWVHQSETPTNYRITDYEGNNYYIREDYGKYDLIAENMHGKKIYVEVKSTRTSIDEADTIALPISSREWKYVNQINENDKYCLARVFDVERNPEGHFLSVMGIGLSTFAFN